MASSLHVIIGSPKKWDAHVHMSTCHLALGTGPCPGDQSASRARDVWTVVLLASTWGTVVAEPDQGLFDGNQHHI